MGELPDEQVMKKSTPATSKVMFRGVEIALSREQVLETAKIRLKQELHAAKQYQTWYVQVDDQQISPKWLVSQLTGLPVSSFHSREARQVLINLGIAINRL